MIRELRKRSVSILSQTRRGLDVFVRVRGWHRFILVVAFIDARGCEESRHPQHGEDVVDNHLPQASPVGVVLPARGQHMVHIVDTWSAGALLPASVI